MKRGNNVFNILLFVTALAVLAACSKSGNNGYGNNTNNNNTANSGNAVSIKGFAFSITSLRVAAGTKVTWTNNDAATHTVTADDNSFDSGDIAPGGIYSRTFASTGTYNYHCKYHGNMKAAVVVQ